MSAPVVMIQGKIFLILHEFFMPAQDVADVFEKRKQKKIG